MKPYLIPDMANKYGHHDMIQSHTELPDFPDFRVRLLFTFLNHQHFAAKHSELFSLAVSLVQMGLDTHETVDNDRSLLSTKDMRSRQLRILAGDYFSSRFYQILAQAGQIEMVKRISEAICEVNRLKMELYLKLKRHSVTAEEYLLELTRLKSGLFECFGELLEEKFVNSWQELLPAICRFETVREELERGNNGFAGSWGFWHILHEGESEDVRLLEEQGDTPGLVQSLLLKYDIRGQLNTKLQECMEQFQLLVKRVDSDKLVAELMQLKEKLLYPLTTMPAALNEMR